MKLAKYYGAVVVVLGLVTAPAGSAFAQDVFLGSWVLDPAKSQGPPGVIPTSGTLEVTAAGGGMYKSVSVTTLPGITATSELTYALDGKDYTAVTSPAQPGAPPLTQTIERVSDTVYQSTIKVGGQAIATASNELSADGKTLTLTTTGIGQFAAISSTMVFNRN
jgi:hypothetical protein